MRHSQTLNTDTRGIWRGTTGTNQWSKSTLAIWALFFMSALVPPRLDLFALLHSCCVLCPAAEISSIFLASSSRWLPWLCFVCVQGLESSNPLFAILAPFSWPISRLGLAFSTITTMMTTPLRLGYIWAIAQGDGMGIFLTLWNQYKMGALAESMNYGRASPLSTRLYLRLNFIIITIQPFPFWQTSIPLKWSKLRKAISLMWTIAEPFNISRPLPIANYLLQIVICSYIMTLGSQPIETIKYNVLWAILYFYALIYPTSFNANLDAMESMNSLRKETQVILPIWKTDMGFPALMLHISPNFM